MKRFIFFLIITLPTLTLGQNSFGKGRPVPTPEIGWDSLYSRIVFPNLPLRADIQAVVWTLVHFNKQGQVDSIQSRSSFETPVPDNLSEIFAEAAGKAFRSTKWRLIEPYPDAWYSFPIYFYLGNSGRVHTIIVEGDRPIPKIIRNNQHQNLE